MKPETEAKVQDLFTSDNFTSRRTTGCNMYDPESLLTGLEVMQGLGYEDKRDLGNEALYSQVVEGRIATELIPVLMPRVKADKPLRELKSKFSLELKEVYPTEPTQTPKYMAYVVQDGNVVQTLSGDLLFIGRKFAWYVSHWQIKNGKFGQRHLRYWENGGKDEVPS